MTAPDSVTLEMKGKVALIRIDNPPVNALSHHVRSGIVEHLDEAVALGATAAVIAGAPRSSGGGQFIAGADIREFGRPLAEPGLPEVIDRIEAAPIPVVAAVEGNTLGGGLEVALGCHYRVADPAARLGLPEVNLGLLPGAGGTQRLPRLLKDVAQAVTMIAGGNPISGEKAKTIGLVDEIAKDAVKAALALAKKHAGAQPTDRRLSERKIRWKKTDDRSFEDALAPIRKKARGAQAPIRAAQMVRNAYEMPFAEGVAQERSTFVELMNSTESAAMRHIFFAERRAAKAPDDVKGRPREVKKVGVIGAGTMGGGIAMTYAEAGLPVTVLETADEALDRGFATIERNWKRGIRSGRTTEKQVEERMGRLSRTTDYADLKDCDLVIEAVFETMDVKRDVFGKLDKHAKKGAVLASNTSYLDVDEIARATKRPKDVLGMHYFSPANVMRLLEVVRAKETSDDALLTALDAARRTRKQPVIAGVGHGFIGNRLLTPYIRQAYLLVLEGASPEQVDRALERFGFAMGVFAVGDLAGLDIGYKSRKDQELDPIEASVYRYVDQMVEAGMLGQKSGAGFYTYDEDRNRSPNERALAIIEQVRRDRGYERRGVSDEEIIERTQFALANEGAHVLAEGVAQRASDIDVTYVHGYGYPRFRGGPMFHASSVGLGHVVDRIRQWQSGAGGVHWKLSDRLIESAEAGGWDAVS